MDRREIEAIRAQLKALDEQLERAWHQAPISGPPPVLAEQAPSTPPDSAEPWDPAPPRPIPTVADVLTPRRPLDEPSIPAPKSVPLDEPKRKTEAPEEAPSADVSLGRPKDDLKDAIPVREPRKDSPTAADPLPGNSPLKEQVPVQRYPIHSQIDPSPAAKFDFKELDFGRKVLPIAGGLLVLWAIALLIRQAYIAGFFGIEFQYSVALITSLLLVVLGIRQPAPREGFGQALTAIGTTGMHLIAIGAHVQLKLYPGEVLLGLTLLISAGNLAYSRWRSSRAFLYLGLLGGLAGASLPGPAISLVIITLMSATSLFIAYQHRWKVELMTGWGASFVAFGIVFLQHASSRAVGVPLAMGVMALVAVVAYGSIVHDKEPEVQRYGLIPAQLTAVFLLVVPTQWFIHPWLLGLGIAMGALAWNWRPGPFRYSLAWQGLGIGLALAQAPAFQHAATLWLLFSTSVAMLALSYRWRRFELVILSTLLWVELVLVGLIRVSGAAETSNLVQIGLASAILLGASFIMVTARTFGDVMLSRLSFIASIPSWWILSFGFFQGRPEVAGFAFTLGSYSAALWVQFWCWRFEWDHGKVAAAIICAVGLYASLEPLYRMGPVGLSLLVGVSSLAVVLWHWVALFRELDSDLERIVIDFGGGVLTSLFCWWMFYPTFQRTFGLSEGPASLLVLSSILLGLGVLSSRRNSPGLLSVAGIGVGVAIFQMPMVNTWYLLRGVYVPIGLVQFAAALLLGYGVSRALNRRELGYGIAAGLAFPPFSLVGYLLFAGHGLEFSDSAAVTFAWILYGTIALGCGFWLRSMPVRIAGLLGFGLTVLKVVTFDFATVTPMVRVGAMFFLGVVLILAGYAYIRLEEGLRHSDQNPSPQ